MSTLKVSEIRNASSATGGLSIAADGVVSGALPYPNRNLLYNGAMQVAQRGTSTASITTSGYYTADRWQTIIGTLGTWTQSIENDAPTGSGFRKSLKMLCTTADAAPAAGDVLIVQQQLEGQDLQRVAKGTSSAQPLTLSFWVKSNATGTYICQMTDEDNSRSVSATYTINASGTWEKKSITLPADTTGAWDNDNASSTIVRWWLGAGSNWTSGTLSTTWASSVPANTVVGQTNLAAATNNYWQITGVQLEVGDTATEFEHLPFGVELARCQRYYCHSGSPEVFSYSNSRGGGIVSKPKYGNYANTSFIPWPVAMRTAPTVTIYNTSTGATGSVRLQSTGLDISAVANRVGWSGFSGVYASGGNFNTDDYAYVPFQADAEL